MHLAADRLGGLVARQRLIAHDFPRLVAHATRDRQRNFTEPLAARDGHEAAADVRGSFRSRQHLLVRGSDNHQILVLAVCRCGERSALEPKSAHKTNPERSGGMMAVDDGDLEYI